MEQRDPQRRNPDSTRDPGETAELPAQGSRRSASIERDKDKPKTPPPVPTQEPADAAPPPDDDVLNIIADVESQLERIRSFQQGHEEQLKSLSERSEALSNAERDLNDAAQAISAQEKKLQEQRRDLEEQAETARKQEQEHSSQLKEAQGELARAQAELAQRTAELETQGRQVHEAQAGFDRQRAELEKQRQELDSRSKQQAQEAQTRAAELKRAQAELGAAREQAESFKQKLASQREGDEQQIKALEDRAAKAEANVGDLIAQVEKLNHELEALRGQVEEAAGKVKDASAKLAQRESQLSETQKKLELASGKLAEFAKVVSKQTGQIEKLPAAMAEIDQQKQAVRKLQEQLAQSKKDFETVSGQLQAMRDQAVDGSGADVAAEMERLRVHAAELEKELFRVKAEAEQAAKTAGETATASAKQPGAGDANQQELREKAQRLKIAAKHLQGRRARLQRYHRALRNARQAVQSQAAAAPAGTVASPSAAAHAHDEHEIRMRQNAQLQQQREELRQLQAMLAVNEQDMVRKWARPKAVITMTGLVIWAVIVATASWFAADHFFPARRSVAVTVQAEPRPGQQLSEQDIEQWRQWHTALISESSFHTAVAKRMESRHFDRYAKADAVGKRIQDDVRVDLPTARQLAFTMAGTDPSDMTLFLDTMATTLAAESSRQLAKRSDGAKAELVGEQRQGNVVSYAVINPVPLLDERLKYGGIIFGVAFSATLIIGIMIYVRLLRAKRLFDEDSAVAPQEVQRDVPLR